MPNPQDDQAPATKQDIFLLMDTLGKMMDKIHGLNTRLDDLEESIDQKLIDLEHRMLLVIENLRHDMLGIHSDKISQHEDRIIRLEKKTGLITA